MVRLRALLPALAGALALVACGGAHGASTLAPASMSANAFMASITPPGTRPDLASVAPMPNTTVQTAATMIARTPQSAIAGLGWTQIPGGGQFVAAAPDGSLWVISSIPGGPLGNGIWHYANGTWTNVPGLATRLAVAPDNSVWAINASGGIYHYAAGNWTPIAGGASDLSVGSDGSVYVISNTPPGPYGSAIYRYTGSWTQLQGAATRIAASWDTGSYPGGIVPGTCFVINAAGSIFAFNPATGFSQIPGAAAQLAPTTNGGLFALGYPVSPAGDPIYYNDLASGTWTQQAGAGTSIATNSSTVYVTSAAGGIYSSPVAPAPAATPTPLPSLPLALNISNLPGQFYGEVVAQFSHVSPRNLVMLPNGDLLAGTGGGTASFAQSGQIYIIPNAEAAVPAAPTVFATLTDSSCASSAGTNTNGITFAPGTGGGTIFVGLECSVWKIPYVTGDRVASSTPVRFLSVRTGSPPAGADGDVHHTTSVLASGSTLYISVGSSCNACTETDPTRAVVLKSSISTPSTSVVATRVRNALALAVNPATGTVWAGGAGQDCVVGTTCFAAMDPLYALNGHPYEWLDPMTTHAAPADYQWPWCEENHLAVPHPDGPSGPTEPAGTSCAAMIVAPVRAPAYSTIMAATFYNPPAGATYAFPSSFNGGLFFTVHGSWHEDASGVPVAVPEVVFVPMEPAADAPQYAMDWSNGGSPYATWARNSTGNPAPFINGFQQQGGTRVGRPVGLAVGASGSLFISDDTTGVIYRIRPGVAPASVQRRTMGSLQR